MPPVTDAPILDIRLLGPPVVLVRGRPLEVDTRKAVAILALLATDGRAYAREELAALLWPDADDPGARGALRRTLSTLRAAVGDGALEVDRARVALVEATTRSDVQELERRAASGSLPDLRAIADLARGPFLAGFSLRDSPEFDDWRATRAVTVERTVLGALDRLGASLQAAGDLPGAIRATERRLDLDPLDEAAHVRLMELLAATRRSLGRVAPVPGVRRHPRPGARRRAAGHDDRALRGHPRWRRGATSAGATGGRRDLGGREATIDRPALPLVGRDGALELVRAALVAPADGDGRLVAIRGEAGIGKTRLAEAAAEDVRSAGGTVLAAAAFPAERAIAYGSSSTCCAMPWPSPRPPPGSRRCRPRPARSWPGCCRPSTPRAARPSPVRHRPGRTPGSSPPSSTG